MSNKGPIYNVELIATLPIPGSGWFQAMATRQDLIEARKRSERTVAAYEVLLEHFKRQQSVLVELRDEFQRQGWTQTAEKIASVIVDTH